VISFSVSARSIVIHCDQLFSQRKIHWKDYEKLSTPHFKSPSDTTELQLLIALDACRLFQTVTASRLAPLHHQALHNTQAAAHAALSNNETTVVDEHTPRRCIA
jgi:hypothetical protein